MKYFKDMEKDAKMSAMKKMREKAMGEMGSKLKKVTVMSPDKPGLEKGLSLAKELIARGPDGMDKESMEEPQEEGMESAEHEMEEPMAEEEMEMDESTPEAIDAKIEELQRKKEMMLAERE